MDLRSCRFFALLFFVFALLLALIVFVSLSLPLGERPFFSQLAGIPAMVLLGVTPLCYFIAASKVEKRTVRIAFYAVGALFIAFFALAAIVLTIAAAI